MEICVDCKRSTCSGSCQLLTAGLEVGAFGSEKPTLTIEALCTWLKRTSRCDTEVRKSLRPRARSRACQLACWDAIFRRRRGLVQLDPLNNVVLLGAEAFELHTAFVARC